MAKDTIAPLLSKALPQKGSNGVSPDANIVLTFNEAVKAGSGFITLSNKTDGSSRRISVADTSQVSFSGTTMTINPATDLMQGSQIEVTFASGVVKDIAGNSFAGLASGYLKFTTADPFNITLNYSGDDKYRASLLSAVKIWENVIKAGLPNVKTANGTIDDLLIDVTIKDDPSKGPDWLGGGKWTALRDDAGKLPYRGELQLSATNVDTLYKNGQLTSVIAHEIGHVLGFGGLWERHGLVNTTTHEYLGKAAVLQYKLLMKDSSVSSIPIEDVVPKGADAKNGTTNKHWRESVFDNELMTSFSDPTMPLSKLTIAAMADLGYSVNYGAADAFSMPPPKTVEVASLYGDDAGAESFAGPGQDESVLQAPVLDVARRALLNDGTASYEVEMEVYDGPVAGLKYMLLGEAGGEAVVGSDSADFMNLLGGDDAAQGALGDDVLDGGTGSNFLTGGNGTDTFFVDGRNGEITWSTVTDFSPNEWATAWGWKAGTSKLTWEAMAGAEGYKGATAHMDFDNDGVIDASMTFTGKSVGAIVTMTGQVGGESYLAFRLA